MIKIPDTLYHYCSVETFLNIIRNKTLRLSDICKANDYMETKWLLEYFQDGVLRNYQEKPFINSGRVIYGLDDIDTIKFFIKNEKEKMLKMTDNLFYVACFSENGDKLSQWRGYADDGYGVSIGFNTGALKIIAEEGKLVKLDKIKYPEKETPIEIKQHIDSFLDSISCSLESGDTKGIFLDDYCLDGFFSLSTKILLQQSIFYKNPAFKEEEEWRIVLEDELSKYDDWECLYNNQDGKLPSDSGFGKLFPKGLQFKSTRNKIISFLDLSFEGLENIITEIIIGPKCEIDEGDIFQLLSFYGYQEVEDINILKSKSTYK